MSDALAKDCLLAAQIMADLSTFETGQGILREAAAELTSLRAKVETADKLADVARTAANDIDDYLGDDTGTYPLEVALSSIRAALTAYKEAGE